MTITEAALAAANPGRRCPSREEAEAEIYVFLRELLPEFPDWWPLHDLVEDGDEDAAEGKWGWAFCLIEGDTTSYVHGWDDHYREPGRLRIEWYGTRWDSETLEREGEP